MGSVRCSSFCSSSLDFIYTGWGTFFRFYIQISTSFYGRLLNVQFALGEVLSAFAGYVHRRCFVLVYLGEALFKCFQTLGKLTNIALSMCSSISHFVLGGALILVALAYFHVLSYGRCQMFF